MHAKIHWFATNFHFCVIPQAHLVHQMDHVTGNVKIQVGMETDFVMMETTIVNVNMMVEIVVVEKQITALNANALTQMQEVEVEIAQVHQHVTRVRNVKMKVGKGTTIAMMETTIVDVNMMVEIVVVA